MKKMLIAMGGRSAEHEVSLATGREMLKHLDTAKYQKRIVIITREKEFYYSDVDITTFGEKEFNDPQDSQNFNGPISPDMSQDIWKECDIVLLGLHGEFGEDGRFQGFLDTLGIPYSGSGVFASAVGMDKIASKYLFESQGVTTPPYSVYHSDGSGISVDGIIEKHGLPCFVKCPQSGSSRLMGRADSNDALNEMLVQFSKSSSEILIESNISGDEYSCPVLEYPDSTVRALPPILIRPVGSDFFDFTAKYTDGACEEIVPAPCSPDLISRMQEISLKAHKILKCRGISRTDMIVKDNIIYTLETNTLPGLTSASLVPKAFAATGGTYSQLLDILIETTLAGDK